MSKIYAIESGASRYYIAGHPTAGAAYGYPSAGGIDHQRKTQRYEFARWPDAQFADLGNVSIQITGKTVRQFASNEAATAFELAQTGVIHEGTLIILWPTTEPGVFKKWKAETAVLVQSIQDRNGVALTIGYTIQAGAPVADTDETISTGDVLGTDTGDTFTTDTGDTIAPSTT